MNKFVIRKPPLYYIDGIPAYKAGEWPGIKSSKFGNTRMIIHRLSSDIFNFNIPDTSNLPRKKLLGMRYSQDLPSRPHIKKVIPLETKSEDIIPAIPGIRPFIPKKYYFEKINEYHDEKEEAHNKLIKQNMFMRNHTEQSSLRPNILRSDYPKDFYDNISRNKLLGVSFTKETFDTFRKNTLPKIKQANEFLENSKNALKHIEGQKMYNLKNKQEIQKRDINYVESLENWGIKDDTKSKINKSLEIN